MVRAAKGVERGAVVAARWQGAVAAGLVQEGVLVDLVDPFQ